MWVCNKASAKSKHRSIYTIYYYILLYTTIYYYILLYTTNYILYTIYYILYTIYYILYTIYYILYTIYYVLYTIYYILYTISERGFFVFGSSSLALAWPRGLLLRCQQLSLVPSRASQMPLLHRGSRR